MLPVDPVMHRVVSVFRFGVVGMQRRSDLLDDGRWWNFSVNDRGVVRRVLLEEGARIGAKSARARRVQRLTSRLQLLPDLFMCHKLARI